MTVTGVLNDRVVVLTIDNPPVNAGSLAVRAGLLEEIRESREIPGLLGIVIAGSGAHFYSGSDIKEFDGPVADPQLPEVIAEIEAVDVPVVAAIRGLALGGGFELALACDARIGSESAVVGLPEVSLGIIPGAGGTVRLPRLVGAETALEMIATAERVPAARAAELGILDEIATDPLARSIEAVKSMSKRRLVDLAPPAPDEERFAEVTRVVSRRGRGRPAVVEATAAVRRAVEVPAREALVSEREIFTRLRTSDEAADLRYLFFAERAAARALGSTRDKRPVHSVTVVGAGTMGSSIAAAFVMAGYRTTVTDTDRAALERATELVASVAARASRPELADTLRTCVDLAEGVREADLVVDAVFEDLEVKTALFRELDACAPERAVLASNTSYLDLDQIGSVVGDPTRVVGLHFFNPAHLNRLVEVVETSVTADDVMATAVSVVRKLDKIGIRARVGEGFVANRVYSAYRAQCEFLIEDGCTPDQIDRAVVDFGFSMGPFAVADMSGLDIAWARRRRLAATRDPRQRYVAIADRLCEAGRLGRKTAAGWYRYEAGSRLGVIDPEVSAIIEAERDRKSITAREIDADTIMRRIIGAMGVEAVGLIEEGIARQPSDIDVALVTGFAFPRWRGGPLRYASRQGKTWLEQAVSEAYSSCPVTAGAGKSKAEALASVTELLARL